MTKFKFTKQEELYHAITHAIGAILSLIGLVLLIAFSFLSGDIWKIISVTIFGTTMLLMYTLSTIVHSLSEERLKDLFQIFDHSSIYLFIAGTYTPFLLVHLQNTLGFSLLAIIWSIAIIGVILKIFFINRFFILSTVIYILMGWLIVLVWTPLKESLSTNGILLLVVGGVSYTIGALFFMWRSLRYHHVIWHLFVLVGSLFHFLAVFFYVI